MPANLNQISAVSSALSALVTDRLACPACLGALTLDGLSIICTHCERAYPILDGIPVLIVEPAVGTAGDSIAVTQLAPARKIERPADGKV